MTSVPEADIRSPKTKINIPKAKERKLTFFFWFSLFLLILAFSAFTLRAWLDTENLPPMRLSLMVHAVTSGLWLLYMPLQAYLITKRKIKIHRPLGWTSVGLAIAVFISGLVISIEFFERMKTDPVIGDIAFSFFFPGVVNFAMYSVCYTMAMAKRHDIAVHKRLMVFASLALIPPALNRLVFAFGLPLIVTNVGWLLLVCVVPLYDLQSNKKITLGSKIGLGLVALSIATIFIGSYIYNM